MPARSIQTLRIDDLADPRVAEYRNVKDAALSSEQGVFLAEGPLVVRELFRSRFQTRSVLIEEGKVPSLADALAELPESVPIYTASQETLDQIAGIHLHRGILAAGVRSRGLGVEELVAGSRVLLVLEDLSNHDNVGGLFRVAAALGGPACGIILSPRCCDPLYRKALRVSIGHALRVPFAVAPLDGALWRLLCQHGFTLIATGDEKASQGEAPHDVRVLAGKIPSASPPIDPAGKRLAIVLGSEGHGLAPETVQAIRSAGGINARIPMTEGVDSLNIVVAGGILLSTLINPCQNPLSDRERVG